MKPKLLAWAGVPGTCLCDSPPYAIYAAICAQPAEGTMEIATKPLGISVNFQAQRGGQIARELDAELGCDVAHAS